MATPEIMAEITGPGPEASAGDSTPIESGQTATPLRPSHELLGRLNQEPGHPILGEPLDPAEERRVQQIVKKLKAQEAGEDIPGVSRAAAEVSQASWVGENPLESVRAQLNQPPSGDSGGEGEPPSGSQDQPADNPDHEIEALNWSQDEDSPETGDQNEPQVPGLTPEELQLFLTSGIPLEDLQRAATEMEQGEFRQRADEILQQIRDIQDQRESEGTTSSEDEPRVSGLSSDEVEQFLGNGFNLEDLQRAASEIDPGEFRQWANETLRQILDAQDLREIEGMTPAERDRLTERIWSPEFIREGIAIAREIINLEAKSYKERYDSQMHPSTDPEFGNRLDELYTLWRRWDGDDRKRAHIASPLTGLTAATLATLAETRQQQDSEDPDKPKPEGPERDKLEDLPVLKDKRDQDGKVVGRGLISTYDSLRDGIDPDNPDATDEQVEERIKEIEGQLSRYFKEARRVGLLNGIDQQLKLLYIDIIRGVYPSDKNRKLGPAEIWSQSQLDDIRQEYDPRIEGGANIIARMAEKGFTGKGRRDRSWRRENAKLEGVWDIYTELAAERFSEMLTLEGLGVVGEATIDGEFTFGDDVSLERLNEVASSVEQSLQALLPDDKELRAQATERFSEDDEVDLRESEFRKLVTDRDRLLRRSMKDSGEAVANYGVDRARYRQMAEESELYWQPTYASYFEVFARTPEQFQVAVETFTQWIRSGLTKSPNELFQRTRGFIDALTTAGQRERTRVSSDFIIGLRQELEIGVSVLGASHSIEYYNVPYYKQFMDFGVADEGPQRFVRLARANRGKVGAILWKLDHDPRMELYHSPAGSRGQLFSPRSALAWEKLQGQTVDLLVAETLGMEIKTYDPRDRNKTTKAEYENMAGNLEDRLRRARDTKAPKEEIEKLEKALEDVRQHNPLERNLAAVASFDLETRLQDLYEGFDLDEQEKLRDDLSKRAERDPDSLKSSERVTLARLKRVERIQEHLARGRSPKELKGEDLRIYQEAKNAVDLALEVYGVTLEKARRGGSIFQVDRNVHIEVYNKLKDIPEDNLTEDQKRSKKIAGILMTVRKGRKINEAELKKLPPEDQEFFADLTEKDLGDFVDYVPNFWAEKYIQFPENWVKATYGCSGDNLDSWVKEKLKEERRKTGEARLAKAQTAAERNVITAWMNPQGIPADELQFRVDQARRMAIWSLKYYGNEAKLWDFTLMRDGKPANPNFGYVEDIFGVPYGIDHKAGNNDVLKYKYAVPENPRILGYNKAGKEVILVFDDTGKPVTGESTGLIFDEQTGEAEIYDQKEETKQITRVDLKSGAQKPIQRERKRVTFDNFKKDIQADEMRVKLPGHPQGKIADFDTVTHHIYSMWTADPYTGYQEQDTDLALSEAAFAGAKRIRDGRSNPENEEPAASKLLILDPTLERVMPFKHRESREERVVLGAIEDSYQAHWLSTDELHAAFFSEDGDDEYNRIAYVDQDWGGSSKMWLNFRGVYARWYEMLGRRGITRLPNLSLHFSSFAGMTASNGVLDVLRKMNYGELGARGAYREINQFGLEKLINQTESAQDLFEAYTGFANPQEKKDEEGYLEKPNNDADVTLQKHRQQFAKLTRPTEGHYEDIDIEYMSDIRRTHGRQERVLQRMRVHETAKRGERGPRWLKGVDVFERNADGSIKVLGGQRVFNGKIDQDADIGSSRHSGTIEFWRMTAWTTSSKHWEGQDRYENVAIYYTPMDYPQIAENRLAEEDEKKGKHRIPASRWTQELGKQVR